jgi:hypothetical protein
MTFLKDLELLYSESPQSLKKICINTMEVGNTAKEKETESWPLITVHIQDRGGTRKYSTFLTFGSNNVREGHGIFQDCTGSFDGHWKGDRVIFRLE